MYDFFFYVRSYRWPSDPPKRVHLLAGSANHAWRMFENLYPPRRYFASSMEHNMFDTSSLSR